MRLLELLRADEKTKIDAAWQTYQRLLEIESPDQKQFAQMKEAMTTLGKTAGDAEIDAATLKELRRQEALIRDGSGLGDEQAAAVKASANHRAETDRQMRERADQQAQLDEANESLNRRYMGAQKATHALNGIIRRNPQLLAGITPTMVK